MTREARRIRFTSWPHIASAVLPDGREVVARMESPTADWVVHIAGTEEPPATGRWLLAVLSELLRLPRGKKPGWVHEAVSELSGRDTPVGRRFPCPCCDMLTLTRPPTGTSEICPVCRWEDDNIQFGDLDYWGGANSLSLREARENFKLHGVSDPRLIERARPPRPEEIPNGRGSA